MATEAKSNAARSVALSSVSQMIGRLASSAIGLVTVAVTTRYLGVDTYGQIATVTIFLSLFLVLTDAGFISIAVRELSKQPSRSRQILGSILALRSTAGLVLAVLAVVIGSLLYSSDNQANVRLGIAVLSGTLVLSAIQTTLTSVIAVRIENYLMVVGELLNKLVVLGGVLWAVSSDTGFYGVVLAYLAGAVVWFVSDAWFSLRRERPDLGVDRTYLKGLVVATLPYSAATIINTMYFRADGFLLSLMKDSAQVGIYSLGYKVVEVTAAFPVFFAMAILPVLSAVKSHEHFERTVRESTRVMTLLGTALTLGVIALAPEVTVFLGGEGFRAAAGPLAILMVGNWLIYQSTVYMQSLLASDNQKSILRVNAVLLGVNVAVNLVLIPMLASTGAALAVVVSEALALVMLRRFFRRHLGRPLGWRVALKPLVPGTVMVAVILLLKEALFGAGLGNEVVLGVSVLVGGAVFVLGSWLTRQFSVADIRAILRPQGESS